MAATRINKQGGRVTLVWLAALSSVISVLWCGSYFEEIHWT